LNPTAPNSAVTGQQPGLGYLYFTIFISGMTTLAVEMTASRLLGSVFGTSNLVWANVIGLILIYLAAGYFIGGRWADRSPHARTLYAILCWGAFLCALIPLVARPVLTTAGAAVSSIDAGLAVGSFAVTLILFALPITLLGTASPFAIRLAVTDAASAGRTSGRIYAVSTLGSLIGTFIPALFLIPEVGTFGTFLLASAVLFAAAWFGLFRAAPGRALRLLWMPPLVAVLAAVVLSGPLRPPLPGMALLYESESGYNYIQVQEDAGGTRYLSLNEGQGVHSEWHPTVFGFGRTWDFFLTAPYFNPPDAAAPIRPVERILIIGLAAGTIARQHQHVYGDGLGRAIGIDGIEIDGRIVEAAAEYFDLNTTAIPGLRVFVGDGRFELNRRAERYSLIAIDAYRPPYIPWHLTTREYFEEVRARLLPDGVVAINVGRTSTDRRLIDALTATLLTVFPSVHAMDVPFSFNTILVATQTPTAPENLLASLALLPADAPALLRDSMALGAGSLVPVAPSSIVFTDDRAPVETMVDSLVLNFFLTGGLSELQGS
jgi:spermidine synthase